MMFCRMPGADYGLERGVAMVLEAGVVAVIFSELVNQGLIPYSWFILFNVVSIAGLVLLVDGSRYWSFGYLFGWVGGIMLSLSTLAQTELIGFFDLVVYGATAVAAVYLRVKIHS